MIYLGARCHPQNGCIFCNLGTQNSIAENELAFAVRDKFPVKPLHTLIIPKRHIADIFAASEEEREAIHEIALRCRLEIERLDPSVAGFNFGSNIGEAAGQKILHAHIHLIPRRQGDIPPPPLALTAGEARLLRRAKG